MAKDGESYIEKLDGFFKILFAMWMAYRVWHNTEIIAFSRSFYETPEEYHPSPVVEYVRAFREAASSQPDLYPTKSEIALRAEEFSRLGPEEQKTMRNLCMNEYQVDPLGRKYKDHYHVVREFGKDCLCDRSDPSN